MSTKIYYGFQIDTTDPKQVLATVKEFRKKHWELDARAHKVWFLSAIVSCMEDPTKQDEHGVNGYSKAEFMWMEAQQEIKKTGRRNASVDTDFQIVVFPLETRFIGIVYTEHTAWFNKFLSMPGVSEYGYWNNTDPPDDITDEQWDERRITWDNVLDGHGVPSMCGFTIDIHNPYGPGFIPKTELLSKQQMEQIIEERLRKRDEE